MELMVCVAIIGIAYSIASPIYEKQRGRIARTEAIAALLTAAKIQEDIFFRTRSYSNDINDLGGGATPSGNHRITLYRPTLTSFTLTARPIGITDDDCGYLSINEIGIKRSAGTRAENHLCWK